ncbi:MAG: Imm49 family immunity protein [Planctomycetota bacterium]
MRSLPHSPDPARHAATAQRLDLALELLKDMQELPARVLFAEQLVLRSLLDHLEDAPPARTVQGIRKGLAVYCAALEAHLVPSPRELWHWVLRALAVRDLSAAHLIATAPAELWEVPGNPVLYPMMFQLKAVLALLRYDEPEADRWARALHAAVFEDPPTAGMKPNLDEMQNVAQLVLALHVKDRDQFNAALRVRTQVREKSLARNGRNAPIGFLDLEGLGLCALARDRGMATTVRHAYLPLDLLDAARVPPEDEPRQGS